MRPSQPSSLSFARTSPHLTLTKKRLRIFVRSRWSYCAKTIMASARVLVFLLFVFHLRAARGPGLDSLGQARHLAAAAAAAGAVATVHPRKLTAVLLSLLQPGRAREIAHLVWLGLRRVQTAGATDLRAAPM